MKVPRFRWLLLGVLAITGASFVAACTMSSKHRLVSGEEFVELAEKPIGSAFHTTYIGSANDRAYLSVWSAMPSSVGGGEDVYSCSLEELSEAVRARIAAGENPWPK